VSLLIGIESDEQSLNVKRWFVSRINRWQWWYLRRLRLCPSIALPAITTCTPRLDLSRMFLYYYYYYYYYYHWSDRYYINSGIPRSNSYKPPFIIYALAEDCVVH